MSTIHVQLTSTAWLVANWQPITIGALMGLSIVVMFYLWFYRQRQLSSSIYFQLVYADTTRVKGQYKAASVLYQQIIQQNEAKQIKWVIYTTQRTGIDRTIAYVVINSSISLVLCIYISFFSF
jgi:hypothetical protein